jgi:hypothetical protein
VEYEKIQSMILNLRFNPNELYIKFIDRQGSGLAGAREQA